MKYCAYLKDFWKLANHHIMRLLCAKGSLCAHVWVSSSEWLTQQVSFKLGYILCVKCFFVCVDCIVLFVVGCVFVCCSQSGIMPVVSSQVELEKLKRRHEVKISPHVGCSLEEVSYAVGEVVGFDSIKSASRMNSAIVIFLDNISKVEKVVENGVVVTVVVNLFTPVWWIQQRKSYLMHLYSLKTRSWPKWLPLKWCKSTKLKHVVCHRRQVFMIPKDNMADLNLKFSFKIDSFKHLKQWSVLAVGVRDTRSAPALRPKSGPSQGGQLKWRAGWSTTWTGRSAACGWVVSPEVPQPVLEPDELSTDQSAEKEQESEADTQDYGSESVP